MDVVITTDTPRYLCWANQFVAASPGTRARLEFPERGSNRAQAISLIQQAAGTAGRGGRVIISVGHGAVTANGSAAWVDLAPNEAFRLERDLIMNTDQRDSDALLLQRVTEMASGSQMTEPAFCERLLPPPGRGARRPLPVGLATQDLDIARTRCRGREGAAQRTTLRADYIRIGDALRQGGVGQVLFLTCRVGNATAFTTRIATDWSVTVQAYNERIVADADGIDGRTRIYREGPRPPTPGSAASRLAETELPAGFATATP